MKNKKEKILFFTKELTIMLKSGISFINGMEILVREEKNSEFKNILKKIYKNLTLGKNIFESFKEFSFIFGNTYLYMIKIGEISGTLTERLEDLSKNIEFEIENKKKISGLLIYPIIVLSLTIIIVNFLLIFILPNFITIFQENNIELPYITRILLFISKNIHLFLLFIILIITIIFFINKSIINNKIRRTKRDKIILNLAFFGELIKLAIASELYRSFSILLDVGHSMLESIDVLYANNNNFYIREKLQLVKKDILSGASISKSLKKLDLYYNRFSILIVSGEESGSLAENLLQISKILKQDFEYNLKKKISFIEPITVLILGFIIAFIVIAIYLPILSMGDIFY